MARAQLSVLTAARFGGGILDCAQTAVDNNNGNYWVNTGLEKVLISNSSGGALTVTVTIPSGYRSLDGAAATKTYSVANTKTALIGPFDPAIFNQSNGQVYIDWSTGTSVTASVLSHVPAQ